ncbi:MAG: hypothetical protein KUG68_07855, partial [Flavobacteriaceae bacterium]|nr:hypothetical protein [Flavobacteriaceae bacterium]
MKYFFSIILLSFFVMSCSSSDDSNSNDNNQVEPLEILLLKNVFNNGSLERQYEYDDNNKLKTETRFGGINPLVIRFE